jgi:hypothetical protein
MGMETLHALTGAGHPAVRAWPDVILRDECITLGRVKRMGAFDLDRLEVGFGLANTTRRFKAPNGAYLGVANEPVARGHGGAIVHQRRIRDHDRKARGVSDHDLKSALWCAPKKLRDSGQIIHPVGQMLSCGDDGTAR